MRRESNPGTSPGIRLLKSGLATRQAKENITNETY